MPGGLMSSAETPFSINLSITLILTLQQTLAFLIPQDKNPIPILVYRRDERERRSNNHCRP